MNKLQIFLKNFLDPLPDPKKELYNKYWTLPFWHLHHFMIEEVIKIVYIEAQTSRTFGLFITQNDLDQEIFFWLSFLNKFGGPYFLANHQEKYSRDDIFKIATEAMEINFDERKLFYFDLIKNSKPKITESNDAYQVHLESVRARILNYVYNTRFI